MKGKIFSKLRDYNYILDQMLEKKRFSEDAKNLLLSMIYKIETSYKDYAQIKGISQKQNEFIDDIIEIVSQYCKYIFLIDPKKEEVKLLKKENVLALTDEKEHRIYAYPTEQAILYGIADIKPKYFYIHKNYYYIRRQLQKLLVEGTILNYTEVIRNFNGWSWNIAEDANINCTANMIYQSFRMLFGEEFLREWEQDSSAKVDYIYEIRKNLLELYGKDNEKSFYIALARLIVASSSKEARDKLKIEYVRVRQASEKMRDKTTYIYRVSEEKKKMTSKIEKIDIMINDRNKLIKEFNKRNDNLPDDKKIFNISELVRILQLERKKYLKRISELNELVKPLNYSKLKNELSEKMQILNVVNEDKNIRDYLVGFQKEVLKCFAKNLENTDSKEEIIEMLYKIRYCRKLRVTSNEKVEDISTLFAIVQKILKGLITKACNNKVFNIFCKDVEYNYLIIEKALNTSIANYEDIDISVRMVDGKLEVTVYDNEIIDRQVEMDFNLNIKDLNVRQKKRVPMYVF